MPIPSVFARLHRAYGLLRTAVGMFEDEADTISFDAGFDTGPQKALVDAFETTGPLELRVDTLRDGQPFEQVDELDDTDILLVSRLIEEASVTNVDVSPPRPARPSTNADWPPAPKLPADRSVRHAGIYKAISSITKLNALRRVSSSNS